MPNIFEIAGFDPTRIENKTEDVIEEVAIAEGKDASELPRDNFIVSTKVRIKPVRAFQLDLHGQRFAKGDLRYAHFIACDLRGCDFREANLENAIFDQCQINGADFTDANFGWNETFAKGYHPSTEISNCGELREATGLSDIQEWQEAYQKAVDAAQKVRTAESV